MAERRMFSKSIISSGKFLQMPPTARLLYYDLGMAADDDGVVEAYTVMTMTKAHEDDLRVLVAKGYCKILNDELVTLICDWNTNNLIRQDRYHESVYKNLVLQLGMCESQMPVLGIPNDNQRLTEDSIGKDSIGKDSKGKDSVGEDKPKRKHFVPPTLDELKDFIWEKGYKVDAERFYYYYESNGWKVGRNAMKDWRAAVAQWNAKDKKPNSGSGDIDWSKFE